MRDSIIFMGNDDHSIAECYKLHKQLDLAIEILGGVQQPPHVVDEEAYRGIHVAIENDWRRIHNIAMDIVMALTGKNIEFKEDGLGN